MSEAVSHQEATKLKVSNLLRFCTYFQNQGKNFCFMKVLVRLDI
jgi:hypothetical protein